MTRNQNGFALLDATHKPPEAENANLHSQMIGVYQYIAGGFAVAGLTASTAADFGLYSEVAGTWLVWPILLAPIALILLAGLHIQHVGWRTAQILFWGYAAVIGLSLGGISFIYAGSSIVHFFLISATTFFGMSLWSETTRSDLSSFDSFLMMGMIGIIFAGLSNLFLGSNSLQFALSVGTVILFTGLTALDIRRIKTVCVEATNMNHITAAAVLGALQLYVDFAYVLTAPLNLFRTPHE